MLLGTKGLKPSYFTSGLLLCCDKYHLSFEKLFEFESEVKFAFSNFLATVETVGISLARFVFPAIFVGSLTGLLWKAFST